MFSFSFEKVEGKSCKKCLTVCGHKVKGDDTVVSPKIGQKLTDKPKDITVKVRMDKETVEKLDEICKLENKNRSEIVREGIEQKYQQSKK